MARDVVLAGIAAAPAGLTAKEIGLIATDGADGRAAAPEGGRLVKALSDEGLLVPAEKRGRFVLTDAGHAALGLSELESAPPTRIAEEAAPRVPLLERLEEAPPEAAPPPSRDATRERQARVRSINETVERLKADLSPDELERLTATLAVHGIDDWRIWLPAMFPRLFTAPFGPHHEEFWTWLWEIEAGKSKEPFVGVWNRGGAKSASAEAGIVALAARKRRKYVLYVSGTQNLADEHVANIGGLLESPELAAAYPGLGQRAVGKYGESKGWRRNRLRTSTGLTIDALGLDVAARGARIDEQRPDLIVLDDVDSENDTPAAVEKKIRTITRKLLPAGSQDCIVIAIQNVIHSNSIFARLANLPGAPRVDFLARRRVSGPIPAVWDLEWRQVDDTYEIVSGRPSWEGMTLDACQGMLDLYGLTAFLVECQHEEADLSGGMFDHLNFEAFRCSRAEVPVLRKVGCWVDPAVTSTDRSDACGIVVDGLGVDRRYYRLWSWERISSPVDALKVAILAAIEFGAQVVGVETDQGGDTWRTVYQSALRELIDSEQIAEGALVPRFESAKAGSTKLSKIERAARMLADYELGRFRHVEGGCGPLEAGLRRFPAHKPFDCVDAAYWSWRWLADAGGEGAARFRARAPRGSVPEVSAGALS